MSTFYIIREYRDREIFAYHRVKVPELLEPKGYTSIISISAFANREHARLYDYNTAEHAGKRLPNIHKRCGVRWYSQGETIDNNTDLKWFEIEAKQMKQTSVNKEQFSIKEHNGVWDFYKFIGYDWKKKKYI